MDGFCTEVTEACEILNVSMDDLCCEKDVRRKLKEQVIRMQEGELYKRMMLASKMDNVLLSGFRYDGKMMKYLTELNFDEARAVFMMRYRMTPTKANFPGRWSGTQCNICQFEDSDEHVFHCPGYADIVDDRIWYRMFWDEDILNNITQLKQAAGVLLLLIKRMEEIQLMVSKTTNTLVV